MQASTASDTTESAAGARVVHDMDLLLHRTAVPQRVWDFFECCTLCAHTLRRWPLLTRTRRGRMPQLHSTSEPFSQESRHTALR